MANQELAYEIALWDHDGTQAKTLKKWTDTYFKVFTTPWPGQHKPRIEVAWEDLPASNGFFRRDIQERWGQTPEVADILVAEAHADAKPLLETVELYPGAAETLQALGELGVKQALVSKSHRTVIENASLHNKTHGFFDAFVGGNEDEVKDRPKPYPESAWTALERLGESRERTKGVLVIGDSLADLEMARNAGLKSVLYRPEENAPFYNYDEMRAACTPDFEITHLTQLIDIFKYGELRNAS